jgi:hypothetical protein
VAAEDITIAVVLLTVRTQPMPGRVPAARPETGLWFYLSFLEFQTLNGELMCFDTNVDLRVTTRSGHTIQFAHVPRGTTVLQDPRRSLTASLVLPEIMLRSQQDLALLVELENTRPQVNNGRYSTFIPQIEFDPII